MDWRRPREDAGQQHYRVGASSDYNWRRPHRGMNDRRSEYGDFWERPGHRGSRGRGREFGDGGREYRRIGGFGRGGAYYSNERADEQGGLYGRGAGEQGGPYGRGGAYYSNERAGKQGRPGGRGGRWRIRGGGAMNLGGARVADEWRQKLRSDDISRLATLEPNVLADKINDQLKQFQVAIGDAKTPMTDVINILSVLVELACQKEAQGQSNASKVIAELLSERSEMFHFNLKQYIIRGTGLTTNNTMVLCTLFLSMLKTFQSLACECLPIDELKQSVKRLTVSGVLNIALMKKAEDLCEMRDEIRSSQNESDSVDGSERDDSKFKLIPILPVWDEINEDKGTPSEVRPNKVDIPYKNWMEYYDIQFRLIREDFIAPLRRGVAAFLQGERGRKNRDVKTYSGARIVSQVTTKDRGICFMVQFDVTGFQKRSFNWEQSKTRLIFGSFLCFIPVGRVNVDNIIFATVADRDSDLLSEEGKFMVQFEGDILEAITHCRKGTEFEIVESNSYFEATSPILRSIQKAEVETMPFTEQLIEGKCDSIPLPPCYLRNRESPAVYDLSCLYGPQTKRYHKPPLMIEVLNKESWEEATDIELDSSQLHAIQMALTQEISVIQGPPGTGKTYIGLKIVEGLLENRKIWDPHTSSPILVMCYTNHALDQFLEGIIDTKSCKRELGVIRVGGRCKNEKVAEKNLNIIRRYNPEYDSELQVKSMKLRDEIDDCNPEKIWQYLDNYYYYKQFLPLYNLQFIVHPNHFYQLSQMSQCAEQQGKEVEVWLGLWEERVELKVNPRKNPKKNAPKKTQPETPTQEPEKFNEEEEAPKNEEKQIECKKEQAETEEITETYSQEGDKVEAENELDINVKEELLELKSEALLAQEERMDQDDMEGFKRVEIPRLEQIQYPADQLPSRYSGDEMEEDIEEQDKTEGDDGNSDVVEVRQWIRKVDADWTISINLLKRNLIMDGDEVEELSNGDITSLNIGDRWRLYNYWAEKQYKCLLAENRRKCKEYSEKCKELVEVRRLKDRHILERADVIGMTTTGAAKNQHILQLIKPKIVIVEEAAEVLEAHIVSALSAGTQHLILIGDHKQLRPKPNEYVLATKYNLRISLFERLVLKKMSLATLEIQHRMRPEIARLVCPHIYDKLVNHESVEKYPNVRGISKNLFFVRHTEPESENPNLLSYQNKFEANYIVGLCAHLLKLGYKPSQITILTPYMGQMLLLRSEMPKNDFHGVNITAIDNFQGEENDIILFSMVRSTNPQSGKTTIGFVKEDNRVCVSLSRAKHGFYAIGNFELFREQTELWRKIIEDMNSQECYGEALPLYCCNHPETKYSAKKDIDFHKHAPNGGCDKMCDTRLACGHSCTEKCHVTNTEHAGIMCKKPCTRICPNGHPCTTGHECFRNCICREIVTKTMPKCGHEQEMCCCTNASDVKCYVSCSKKCHKGHPCQKKCFEKCDLCPVLVEKVIPRCHHKQMVPCGTAALSFMCTETCSKPCSSGMHLCKKKCFEKCGECKVLVSKQVPVCGHMQDIKCYKEPDPQQCRGECEQICPNGLHVIKKICCNEWPECMERVTRKLPGCGHEIELKCFEDLSNALCCKPCEKRCESGHQCPRLCHEKCPPCRKKVEKTLLCGHIHVILCSKTSFFKCPRKCLKSLCERHHKCQKCCHYPQPCGPCCEMVTVEMPNCNHKQKVRCFESTKPSHNCQHPCEKKLNCGHICQNKCSEICQTICTSDVRVRLACGHNGMVKCHDSHSSAIPCMVMVKVNLECGHTFQTKCCYKTDKSRLLGKCTSEICKRVLECGHMCQEPCSKSCTEECKKLIKKRLACGHEVKIRCHLAHIDVPCNKMCRQILQCGHACKKDCGKPCSCPLKSIRQYPCSHSAKIPCNSTIKCHPCTKKCGFTLSCGHRCTGICGDCSSRRMHAVCIFEIELRRFCGHSVTLPCAGLSDSCDKLHTTPCAHGKDSSQCHEACGWKCKHYECAETCGEECDRPLCNKPCDKQLQCGHTCPGLCGERCMSYCHQCNPKKFMEQFHPKPKKGRVPQNPPFFELGCGHIFTVNYLDDQIHNPDRAVGPKQCPKCHQNIVVGSRYGDSVRRAVTDIMNISEMQRDILQGKSLQTITTERYGRYSRIQRAISNVPECMEKDSLIQHVKSAISLYRRIESFDDNPLGEDIHTIVDFLMENATREPKSEKEYMNQRWLATQLIPEKRKTQELYLTSQLLNDFRSELYRVSLRVQCSEAYSQNLSFWSRVTSSFTSSTESRAIVIQGVQQYLDKLNPIKDRISEKKYGELSEQITKVAPDVVSLPLLLPPTPPVVKGTWRKCRAGHYFCTSPKCGTDSKVANCPMC